jgi:hypothetical protein
VEIDNTTESVEESALNLLVAVIEKYETVRKYVQRNIYTRDREKGRVNCMNS